MLLYQGMVVLAASQVWWTWEVEDVFNKVKQGDKQAMKNYGKKMHNQIDDLVTRITMELSKNDRKKYNTVLIIDVHARDIVDSFIRGRWVPPRNTEIALLFCPSVVCSTMASSFSSRPHLASLRPGSLSGRASCAFTGTASRMSSTSASARGRSVTAMSTWASTGGWSSHPLQTAST